MFLGVTWEKILVILVVAALVIGPERLPRYAEGLARFVRNARDYLTTAKTRVKDEMGADFDDVDWRTLDPRRYDPRRIIREALLDDAPVAPKAAPTAATPLEAAPTTPDPRVFRPGGSVPFDSEAT